jgi:hypothetical protein
MRSARAGIKDTGQGSTRAAIDDEKLSTLRRTRVSECGAPAPVKRNETKNSARAREKSEPDSPETAGRKSGAVSSILSELKKDERPAHELHRRKR